MGRSEADKQLEKLILEVEKNPPLYDKSSDLFKDTLKKISGKRLSLSESAMFSVVTTRYVTFAGVEYTVFRLSPALMWKRHRAAYYAFFGRITSRKAQRYHAIADAHVETGL